MATLWTGFLAVLMLACLGYSQETYSTNSAADEASSVTFLTLDSNIEESSVTTNHFLTGEMITEETLTAAVAGEEDTELIDSEIPSANSQSDESNSPEIITTVEITVPNSNLDTATVGEQLSSTTTVLTSTIESVQVESNPTTQLPSTIISEEKETTQISSTISNEETTEISSTYSNEEKQTTISNTFSSEENLPSTQPVEVPFETDTNTLTTIPPTEKSSDVVTSTTLPADPILPDDTTSTAPTTVSVPSSTGASEKTTDNSLTDNVSNSTTQIFVTEDNSLTTVIATNSRIDETTIPSALDIVTDQHKEGRSITFNSNFSTTSEFTEVTETASTDTLVNETNFDALVDTSTSHSVGNNSNNTSGPILVTASAGYQPTTVEVVCIITIIFNVICCFVTCFCAYRVMKRKHVCSYDLPPLTSTFSEIDNNYEVGRRNMGMDLSPEDTESTIGHPPSRKQRKPKPDSAIVISSDDGWCVPYDPTTDTEMKQRENSNDDKNVEEDIRL